MLNVLGLSGATKRVVITRLLALKKVSLLLLLAILLAAIGAHAQTITTVTGTIIDPQGVPYANGSVAVTLSVAGGTTLTVTATGAPAFNPPTVTTNSSGFFMMNVIASASYSTSTPYVFTFCAPYYAGTDQISGGAGVCFSSSAITIAGASQDISATVNPLALSLGRNWNPSRVFSTAPAAGTSSIGATTMVASVPASPAAGTRYVLSAYVTQTVLGASCAGNSTIVLNAIFQDPNAASAQTTAIATYTVTTNGTLGIVPLTANAYGGAISFLAKPGTAIQYSTTYTPGGSCSPAPAVQLFPILEFQ